MPFFKRDGKKKKKSKNRKGNADDRREIVIKVPVPEVKKPQLFKKKSNRSIATVRLPTLLLRINVDENNLYIGLGYNDQNYSVITIPKEEIPLRFQRKSYSFVWVYKSQELSDYYVRGRGYLVRHVIAPPYKVGRMMVQSEVKVFIGKFNGKYPKVKAKGRRLLKEGIIDFEEKPAEFLIVVEDTVTSFDARSNTPIMFKNVFFRLARIPEKYRPFWDKFDKRFDADTQFKEFYEGLDEEEPTTMEIEAYDEEEEDTGGGFSFLSKLWGHKKDEEEEENRDEDEENDDDDLPDISL